MVAFFQLNIVSRRMLRTNNKKKHEWDQKKQKKNNRKCVGHEYGEYIEDPNQLANAVRFVFDEMFVDVELPTID